MNTQAATAPFSCTYTPNLPELLIKLNCSIVISTFQAGKVVMLSPQDENTLFQLVRDFHKPMGIAFKEDWMAIATESEVHLLKDSPELARTFPHDPNTYDHFYFPRSTYGLLTSVIVKALQELEAENNEMQAEIDDLEAENATLKQLKARLVQLEAENAALKQMQGRMAKLEAMMTQLVEEEATAEEAVDTERD